MLRKAYSQIRDLGKQLYEIVWGDGYILHEPCLNKPQETADFHYVLHAFREVAREKGLTWWLDYGTLLGAWRYQQILPFDHDTDVGYLAEEREQLESCLEAFAERDIHLSLHYSALFYKDQKMLDIYPWTRREGRLMHRPDEREGFIHGTYLPIFDDVPVGFILPVQEIRFLGEWFSCPNQPKKLLRHRYPSCRLHMRLVFPHRQRCWFCLGFWREVWRIWFDRSGPVLRSVHEAVKGS